MGTENPQNKFGFFALVVLVIVFCDQITKSLIVSHLSVHEVHPVIPGFFDIVHFRNTGAAFGIFSGTFSHLKHYFFLCISLVVLSGILVYIWISREVRKWEVLALAMVFSGALGNFIDRLRFQEVIDFLYFHWHKYYWPAFNVSDSAISIGTVLLILLYIKR